MYFGAHMSTSGGVWTALQRGKSIRCDAIQIFVKSNMRWYGRPYLEKELLLYAAEQKKCAFQCVFGHAGYLINLGARPSPNRDHSLKSLIQELELAASLKLPFLVLHPGAHLGAGEAEATKQIVSGLDAVFEATKKLKVRIALENTAGQGTCLGHELHHITEIFQRAARPERLAVCLDTAHLFAAGYDVRSPKGWNAAIAEISSEIGIKQIVAFHLNDSKTDFGSRVDRHEHIGKGKIGKSGFCHIVNDPRFKKIPACLETFKSDDLHEDVENLGMLRSLLRKK
jgi:deoxyribonuclease-4